METTQIGLGIEPYNVVATIISCGRDIVICIGGGEKKHVGAVALASPRPSLKNIGETSATASVLCLVGHKDDILARTAALRLAAAFKTNVLVSVGLHMDSATEADINILQNNFDKLINEIEVWLQKLIDSK